jgi:hypothetical protein
VRRHIPLLHEAGVILRKEVRLARIPPQTELTVTVRDGGGSWQRDIPVVFTTGMSLGLLQGQEVHGQRIEIRTGKMRRLTVGIFNNPDVCRLKGRVDGAFRKQRREIVGP